MANHLLSPRTVKLWLLELNPPLLSYDLYDACLSLYPAVGADEENDKSAEVSMLLSKLPGAQLFVLDAVVGHLKRLIEGTKTDEEEGLYVTKLALSVGRSEFCLLLISMFMDMLPYPVTHARSSPSQLSFDPLMKQKRQ